MVVGNATINQYTDATGDDFELIYRLMTGHWTGGTNKIIYVSTISVISKLAMIVFEFKFEPLLDYFSSF